MGGVLATTRAMSEGARSVGQRGWALAVGGSVRAVDPASAAIGGSSGPPAPEDPPRSCATFNSSSRCFTAARR